jgi:hypothetical protein
MRHFRTFMLLAIAVTLAMPTFADTPSNPTNKSAKSPNKGMEVNSFQFGTGRGVSAPNPQSSDKKSNAPIPKLTLTPPSHNVATPVVKNPPVSDPCKAPNPPHSCKRTRPTH